MRKIIILLAFFLLSLSTSSFSQSTEKKYQYIVVTIEANSTGKWKETLVDFGTDFPIVVDKKDEITKKVESFSDGVDVLNYLGSMGWEYVERQILFNNTFYVYTFKRLVDK